MTLCTNNQVYKMVLETGLKLRTLNNLHLGIIIDLINMVYTFYEADKYKNIDNPEVQMVKLT